MESLGASRGYERGGWERERGRSVEEGGWRGRLRCGDARKVKYSKGFQLLKNLLHNFCRSLCLWKNGRGGWLEGASFGGCGAGCAGEIVTRLV